MGRGGSDSVHSGCLRSLGTSLTRSVATGLASGLRMRRTSRERGADAAAVIATPGAPGLIVRWQRRLGAAKDQVLHESCPAVQGRLGPELRCDCRGRRRVNRSISLDELAWVALKPAQRGASFLGGCVNPS